MLKEILRADNLCKEFPIFGGFFGRQVGAVKAVEGISFSLSVGKTLGLVGESGCGKSTLGRTLLRLLQPSSGDIFFQGQNITNLSASALRPLRREMQLIFQDPFSSLNPRMDVGKILDEPFRIHKLLANKQQRQQRILELLDEVGLPPESLHRYPHEFSGGQRQRIGIARALALKPKLIVADEPVSALDVSIQSQILNLLKDLREKYNLSYVFIAHDLAVIEHISHDIMVMYLGKVAEYTDCETLYKNPKHPYTQALLASIPSITHVHKRTRAFLTGDIPSPINPPTGCRFHTRCPLAEDQCKKVVPILRNIAEGPDKDVKPHYVACHLV